MTMEKEIIPVSGIDAISFNFKNILRDFGEHIEEVAITVWSKELRLLK